MDDKHVLGPLCKRGHSWQGSQQSLRYRSTRQCTECMRERKEGYDREYREVHRDQERARARRSYHDNRDLRLEQMAAYRQTPAFKASVRRWRERNRERNLSGIRDWKRRNQAHVRSYWRAWTMTPTGRLHNQIMHRKRNTHLAQFPRDPYTAAQLRERFRLFGDACAYCGASGIRLVADHIKAVSKGGRDALNNLAPACDPCNQSKYNHDVEAWYRAQASFSPERWARLREAMA